MIINTGTWKIFGVGTICVGKHMQSFVFLIDIRIIPDCAAFDFPLTGITAFPKSSNAYYI